MTCKTQYIKLADKLKDFSFLKQQKLYSVNAGAWMHQHNGHLIGEYTQARSTLPLSFFLQSLFNGEYQMENNGDMRLLLKRIMKNNQ